MNISYLIMILKSTNAPNAAAKWRDFQMSLFSRLRNDGFLNVESVDLGSMIDSRPRVLTMIGFCSSNVCAKNCYSRRGVPVLKGERMSKHTECPFCKADIKFWERVEDPQNYHLPSKEAPALLKV